MALPHPRRSILESGSPGILMRTWPSSIFRASSSHRQVTMAVPLIPSMTSSADTSLGPSPCRQRQLLRHTCERVRNRRTSPVRRTSSASAKLDLPDPLRPHTTVRPGPGLMSILLAGPIPRKPATVTDFR